MPAKQVAPIFNWLVCSKYRYGLVMVGVGKEQSEWDKRWKETVLKVLIKTQFAIKREGEEENRDNFTG